MNNSDIYKQSEDCLLEDMDGELLLIRPKKRGHLALKRPFGNCVAAV